MNKDLVKLEVFCDETHQWKTVKSGFIIARIVIGEDVLEIFRYTKDSKSIAIIPENGRTLRLIEFTGDRVVVENVEQLSPERDAH